MTIIIVEEYPDSASAAQLIAELEAHLVSQGYPQESRHGYSIEKLVREGVAFFVSRYEGIPAGCGGIQLYGTAYGEVKRMYVRLAYRGMGLGKLMLDRLSEYARERQVGVLRLETGIFRRRRSGSTKVTDFSAAGRLVNIAMTHSVCFLKSAAHKLVGRCRKIILSGKHDQAAVDAFQGE